MRTLRFAGLLAVLALATACASTKPDPLDRRLAEMQCRGQTLLAVSNNTGREVEIYQTRTGSAGEMIVATVPPGYRVLEVETGEGIGYGSRIVGGEETVAATSRPRARDRHTVDLRYICRNA